MRHFLSRERGTDLAVVVVTGALVCAASTGWSQSFSAYPSLASRLPHLASLLPAFPAVALAGVLLLWWRRRCPVLIAMVLLPTAMAVSALAPAALAALYAVAAYRPWRTTAWAAALALLPVPLALAERGLIGVGVQVPDAIAALLGITLITAVVGWGLLAAARGERSAQAEREAVLRAEQAQQHAREDIAREMHDVLAHRLSLLSIHAGALEVAPNAPAADVQRAAGVIRDSAHQALEDLREIIGVLRASSLTTSGADRPQPTLIDLPQLVAEAQQAGMRAQLELAAPAATDVPPATGRTAYRIVQEALTNARKHAPNAPVTITVHGRPPHGLTIEVANPVPPNGANVPIPGGGQGLRGLMERASLAGGRLTYRHGTEFRLSAWLPWDATTQLSSPAHRPPAVKEPA
ncbi:sensor histidine kinase [Streptomyces sp. NBC_01304]|uniref:sensor histidine kinase n=1 Tax=Streptomyces sp. NBC_01304 TaxID=2903818 RepID=UPI002E1338AC|nr:histidine kinase [Streptomyces sp. NBC_01304]